MIMILAFRNCYSFIQKFQQGCIKLIKSDSKETYEYISFQKLIYEYVHLYLKISTKKMYKKCFMSTTLAF